jgi:hypothetical protein
LEVCDEESIAVSRGAFIVSPNAQGFAGRDAEEVADDNDGDFGVMGQEVSDGVVVGFAKEEDILDVT